MKLVLFNIVFPYKYILFNWKKTINLLNKCFWPNFSGICNFKVCFYVAKCNLTANLKP